MLRHALRDAIRHLRNVIDHARHGGRCELDGEVFDLPARVPREIRRALRCGAYEAPERALIAAHLPSNLPVVELGGSIGVVGRFIGRKIDSGVRHLVVEANPALPALCREVARGASDRPVEVISAALDYSGRATIAFKRSSGLLDSRVVPSGRSGAIEVPVVRLAELRERLGSPSAWSLVADIEGAEYDLFSQDVAEFGGCRALILEMHPAAFAERGATLDDFLAMVTARGFRLVEQVGMVAAFTRDAD